MSEEIGSDLEEKIKEKNTKLENQSSKLNYLTNEIIPKLKKENAELKAVKTELSQALENSTKKYYDQLDINADLSDSLAKTGADFAVAKVRIEKLEEELGTVKQDSESKIEDIKTELENSNPEELEKIKEENQKLTNQLNEKTSEIEKLEEEVPQLKSEIDKLRKNLIEIGDYKEKVDSEVKGKIIKLENEIESLNNKIKEKQSSYDKLYDETQKTINDLENQNKKLKKAIEKHSNRGFIQRLSNKPIEVDDD